MSATAALASNVDCRLVIFDIAKLLIRSALTVPLDNALILVIKSVFFEYKVSAVVKSSASSFPIKQRLTPLPATAVCHPYK